MQSAESIRKPFPAIVTLSAAIAAFLIWLIYFKGRVAKLEIALVRGKKAYDKREAISQRDARREIERRLKERGR